MQICFNLFLIESRRPSMIDFSPFFIIKYYMAYKPSISIAKSSILSSSFSCLVPGHSKNGLISIMGGVDSLISQKIYTFNFVKHFDKWLLPIARHNYGAHSVINQNTQKKVNRSQYSFIFCRVWINLSLDYFVKMVNYFIIMIQYSYIYYIYLLVSLFWSMTLCARYITWCKKWNNLKWGDIVKGVSGLFHIIMNCHPFVLWFEDYGLKWNGKFNSTTPGIMKHANFGTIFFWIQIYYQNTQTFRVWTY